MCKRDIYPSDKNNNPQLYIEHIMSIIIINRQIVLVLIFTSENIALSTIACTHSSRNRIGYRDANAPGASFRISLMGFLNVNCDQR